MGLDGANLTEIARAVARTLELPDDEVLVIDARGDLLALDVLRRSINPRQLVGKRDAILAAIADVDGVSRHRCDGPLR